MITGNPADNVFAISCLSAGFGAVISFGHGMITQQPEHILVGKVFGGAMMGFGVSAAASTTLLFGQSIFLCGVEHVCIILQHRQAKIHG